MTKLESLFTFFIDLDGVLVDFKAGVEAVCGKTPEALEPSYMWKKLAKEKDFYGDLSWMPDGKELWNFVLPYNPLILTGLPWGNWAEGQKRRWCSRELGKDIKVITCLSKDKALAAKAHIRPGTRPLLVDDRKSLQSSWEKEGGLFILHQSSNKTIQALSDLAREQA